MATVNLFGDLALEATLSDVKVATESLADTVVTEGSTVAALTGQAVMARVHTGADPTLTDGTAEPLTVNQDGRLRVSAKPGYFPSATGDLATTSGVASNVANAVAGAGFVAIDVSDASNVVYHVKNVGSVTHAAGQYVFEASVDSTTGTDGTWVTIQAIRSNANTIEASTGTLSMVVNAGTAYAWEASVNAFRWIRVRCSTNATTNAIARWTILRGTYATEPIPGAQTSGTQPVSGTVTSNFATPTPSNINSAANTNGTAVKTSAGTVYNVAAFNNGAAAAYVKFYNKASAPTVGTDVPIIVIKVNPGENAIQNFGTLGHRFTTGIGLAITGGAADTDTTATTAGQVKVLTSYI